MKRVGNEEGSEKKAFSLVLLLKLCSQHTVVTHCPWLLLCTQEAFPDKHIDLFSTLPSPYTRQGICLFYLSLIANPLPEIWLSPVFPDHRIDDLSDCVFLRRCFLAIYSFFSFPSREQSWLHSDTEFYLLWPGTWNNTPAQICPGRQLRHCLIFTNLSISLSSILVNKMIRGLAYWFSCKIWISKFQDSADYSHIILIVVLSSIF